MERIKIKFGYFWKDFDPEDNLFTRALRSKYELEFSENPDFYFFTHTYNGQREYLEYQCHRIFLGWENERADWNICDYVLDSDFYKQNPYHKRFPIWASWDMEKLCRPKELATFAGKTKFCCMIVSNPHAKQRIQFFHKLSEYKQVDSGGRYLNNIGFTVENKLEFLKDYKFVISFENSSYPGYTTEKLIEPMLMNTIPIYWGNPVINADFNTSSFVNVNDSASFEAAIQRIIELDQDDNKYLELAMEPWFKENRIPEEMDHKRLVDFLEYIVNDSKTKPPVAKSFFKKYKHLSSILFYKVKWVALEKLGINNRFR